jgi:hypothetical protein
VTGIAGFLVLALGVGILLTAGTLRPEVTRANFARIKPGYMAIADVEALLGGPPQRVEPWADPNAGADFFWEAPDRTLVIQVHCSPVAVITEPRTKVRVVSKALLPGPLSPLR